MWLQHWQPCALFSFIITKKTIERALDKIEREREGEGSQQQQKQHTALIVEKVWVLFSLQKMWMHTPTAPRPPPPPPTHLLLAALSKTPPYNGKDDFMRTSTNQSQSTKKPKRSETKGRKRKIQSWTNQKQAHFYSQRFWLMVIFGWHLLRMRTKLKNKTTSSTTATVVEQKQQRRRNNSIRQNF